MNIKSVALLVALMVSLAGGWYLLGRQGQSDTTADSGSANQLIIYSGRKEPLILPIIQAFEQETGIKTIIKSGSTEELANLIMQEGENTQADVYIGTDASLLQVLSSQGLLSPITTGKLQSVPAEYRADDDNWTGVSGRSRVLIVNTDMVAEEEYPNSIYDITDPSWKGKVAMAQLTNESVVTHISALHEVRGEEFVEGFLQGLKDNDVTFLPGHTDVRKAVGRGEFAVGLVNHYYGHLQVLESENIEILYTDQGAQQDGTFVNVSGVGITSASKNKEAAQRFVDFLLAPATQKQFADLNFEYPLVAGVLGDNVRNLGEFEKMDVSLYEVALLREKALQVIRAQGL